MRAPRLLALILAASALAADGAWAIPQFVTTEPIVVPRRPFDVAVGDLNNDGIDDLAVIGRGSNKVSIVLVENPGTFRQGASIPIGTRLKAIGIGDFNGDDKGDVAVITGTRNIFVVPGNGDGTFGRSITIRRCCSGAGVVVGDFNNSRPESRFGDDLAIADPLNDDVNILFNRNTPNTQTPSFITPGIRVKAGNRPLVLEAGDFNHDGFEDVAALNTVGSGNDISSILNAGGGSFSNIGNFFAGKRSRSMSLGDYNGDTELDLFSGDQRPNLVNLIPGLGGGRFGTGPSIIVPCAVDDSPEPSICRVRGVVSRDFDGDGKADLAALTNGRVSSASQVGTGGGDQNAVLAFGGDGAGGYTTPIRNSNVGLNARVMKAGRFNNDDKPDLVVASWGASQIRLLLNISNDPSGVTSTRTPTGTGGPPVSVTPTPPPGVATATRTQTQTPCNGQGCPCDPLNNDDDCAVPFFCADEDEVCCDTPCEVANVSCSLPGSVGTCKPIDLPNGEECTADEQCQSGFCVDGFCCDTECTGSTEACDMPPGTCTDTGNTRPPATNTPTPSQGQTAAATQTASRTQTNGTGATPTQGGGATPTIRLKELGESCAMAPECRSTFCPPEDLVCCNSACTGQNERCDLPPAPGQCLPINIPDDQACQFDVQCLSRVCEGGFCRGDLDTRTPTRTVTAGGDSTGTPTPRRSNGDQCTDGSQCASGNCPDDGVCCNEACTGANESCNLDGAVGTCLPTDLDNGNDCNVNGQCLSNNCPDDDDVCCNEACNGANESCELDGAVGTCLPTDLDNGNPCQVDAQCLSNNCDNNFCTGPITPRNTSTPGPPRTATPTRGSDLVLARGDGCAAGDNSGDGFAGLAVLLAFPLWAWINARRPAVRRVRRRTPRG